jgi:hypothetical protein
VGRRVAALHTGPHPTGRTAWGASGWSRSDQPVDSRHPTAVVPPPARIPTSVSIDKSGANPISDRDITPFTTRPRRDRMDENPANFDADSDDRIQQGPPLPRLRGRGLGWIRSVGF